MKTKSKTKWVNVFVLAAALPWFGCAPSGSEEGIWGTTRAIISGQDVELDSPISRSTVMLNYGAESCSGSLVSPHVVLTSAHCFDEVSDGADKNTIEFHSSQKTRTRRIRTIVTHPDWDISKSNSNDIALVSFRGDLPEGAQVAVGIENSQVPSVGDSVIIAGYGNSNTRRWNRPGELKKAQLVVASTQTPAGKDLFVLTGSGSLCFGDSGGPTFLEKEGQLFLIGVNEGVETPRCEGRSVSTRIADHIEWIRKSLRSLEN